MYNFSSEYAQFCQTICSTLGIPADMLNPAGFSSPQPTMTITTTNANDARMHWVAPPGPSCVNWPAPTIVKKVIEEAPPIRRCLRMVEP